jgi:hypothetical protein
MRSVFIVIKTLVSFYLLWLCLGWPWWGKLLLLVIGLPSFFLIDTLLGIDNPMVALFQKPKGTDDDDPSGNDNVGRNFTDYM